MAARKLNPANFSNDRHRLWVFAVHCHHSLRRNAPTRLMSAPDERIITAAPRFHTPSCGGQVPTAERTLDPARMLRESLNPGPELENSQGHSRPIDEVHGTSA